MKKNLQLSKFQFHFFHQLNPSIDQEAIRIRKIFLFNFNKQIFLHLLDYHYHVKYSLIPIDDDHQLIFVVQDYVLV